MNKFDEHLGPLRATQVLCGASINQYVDRYHQQPLVQLFSRISRSDHDMHMSPLHTKSRRHLKVPLYNYYDDKNSTLDANKCD